MLGASSLEPTAQGNPTYYSKMLEIERCKSAKQFEETQLNQDYVKFLNQEFSNYNFCKPEQESEKASQKPKPEAGSECNA